MAYYIVTTKKLSKHSISRSIVPWYKKFYVYNISKEYANMYYISNEYRVFNNVQSAVNAAFGISADVIIT